MLGKPPKDEKPRPQYNPNVSWPSVFYKYFKEIIVAILFLVVMSTLIFYGGHLDSDVKTVLITTLGGFSGYLIGRKND